MLPANADWVEKEAKPATLTRALRPFPGQHGFRARQNQWNYDMDLKTSSVIPARLDFSVEIKQVDSEVAVLRLSFEDRGSLMRLYEERFLRARQPFPDLRTDTTVENQAAKK